MSQPARQQLAEFFEHRIRGGDVGVDPLQIAQNVEVQRAGLDAFDAARPDTGKMDLCRMRLELAENFLLAEQAACRPRIVGHEHGRGGMDVDRQAAPACRGFPSDPRLKRRGLI